MWQPKGFTEYGLAYSEDGGKSWNHCEGASTAIAVGIGKAKDGADYETVFIWGASKEGDPIGIYRSTDKCKTFERVNDDMHQFGGPGNGNFVQGDMNTFGVVYMSTVGRGLIVGAPEGTEIVLKNRQVAQPVSPRLQQEKRTLHVTAPMGGTLSLFAVNGKAVLSKQVAGLAHVSLESLPAGRYVAKLLNSTGKPLAVKLLQIK